MNLTKVGEVFASMLVMLGVIAISFGVSHDRAVILFVGSALLVFGVRLTIDMGRADG